ncbi:MAG: SDR family NAD(P)-dependent oxidoreductase [Pseudomonadota bacterium]
MIDLRDKLALVTGATSGIGAAIADALALQGARLIVCGSDPERLRRARARINEVAPGTDVEAWLLDLGEPLAAQLPAAVPTALDVLVHAAGDYRGESILATTPAQFEQLLRINAVAPLALTQALADGLRAAQGQVVFVNSSAARQAPKAAPGAYAASKHALAAIAGALRDGLNEAGVRVLSIYPGRTATPMQAALFEREGRDYPADKLLQAGDIAAAVCDALRLPRTAELTDLDIRPLQKW